MKDYTISFSGLAEGMHDFRFVLGAPFFTRWEDETIRNGDMVVEVVMEKQTRMLLFNFNIYGVVEVLCDRCADPLQFGVKGTQRLIAKVSNEEFSTDDDIIFIREEDFEIDLAPHLFDYIHLMLPMKMTHDNSADGVACDPEMIKLLQQYTRKLPAGQAVFLPDEDQDEDTDDDDELMN